MALSSNMPITACTVTSWVWTCGKQGKLTVNAAEQDGFQGVCKLTNVARISTSDMYALEPEIYLAGRWSGGFFCCCCWCASWVKFILCDKCCGECVECESLILSATCLKITALQRQSSVSADFAKIELRLKTDFLSTAVEIGMFQLPISNTVTAHKLYWTITEVWVLALWYSPCWLN